LRLGLAGKRVLGFIGTFGRWHGAEVLAEAFGKLLAENLEYRDDVRLLLIGDGVTMPEVMEKLQKHGVAPYCVRTGLIPQEQGPEHLAACDILVSPHVPNPDGSEFFGSPTKLFEYLAMGKAIVASRLGQIEEIMRHGQTGWLVEPGQADALKVGLEQLLEDPGLRHRLGRAARNAAVQKYTWKQHTQRILERLEEVCAEPATTRLAA
jgi:glycosyltransferase involved in cell wall biosynthesis